MMIAMVLSFNMRKLLARHVLVRRLIGAAARPGSSAGPETVCAHALLPRHRNGRSHERALLRQNGHPDGRWPAAASAALPAPAGPRLFGPWLEPRAGGAGVFQPNLLLLASGLSAPGLASPRLPVALRPLLGFALRHSCLAAYAREEPEPAAARASSSVALAVDPPAPSMVAPAAGLLPGLRARDAGLGRRRGMRLWGL